MCKSDTRKAFIMNKYLLIVLITLFAYNAYSEEAVIILNKSGCRSFFIADGPNGYYLLEWFGGYDPSKGDVIVGELVSFGFKDVYYPNRKQKGRVWVDDYMLSKNRVLEKYSDKCD